MAWKRKMRSRAVDGPHAASLCVIAALLGARLRPSGIAAGCQIERNYGISCTKKRKRNGHRHWIYHLHLDFHLACDLEKSLCALAFTFPLLVSVSLFNFHFSAVAQSLLISITCFPATAPGRTHIGRVVLVRICLLASETWVPLTASSKCDRASANTASSGLRTSLSHYYCAVFASFDRMLLNTSLRACLIR